MDLSKKCEMQDDLLDAIESDLQHVGNQDDIDMLIRYIRRERKEIRKCGL